MLLRAIISLVVMVVLMWLVKLQINAAHADRYLTVEQLVAAGKKALSWDRHYAMPIDYSIFPGLAALCIFLCAQQWTLGHGFWAGVISWGAILFCLFVLWIGGTEAHVHDGKPTLAGYYHGVYAAILVWVMIMTLVFTPKPPPVLLLMLCIAVPAFFFVGTHMFLGMVNAEGAATTYPNHPLKDPVGWTVIVVVTGIVWWRSYMLIPQSFWDALR